MSEYEEFLNHEELLKREEWLKQRMEGIGGSDAAIVLGISPFKSRTELWHEKVSKKIELDAEEALIFQIGHALEPIVAKKYASMTGRKLEMRPRRIHPDYPFMIGNIDREIVDDKRGPGILEIKTKGAWTDWHDEDIPPYYMTQVQHYLSVFGYEWAGFAVLDLGTRKVTHIDIERDDKLISNIISEEEKFWELVQNKMPPTLEGSAVCGKFLREHFKLSENRTVELIGNDEATKWANILKGLKAQAKSLDAQEVECKNYLMSLVGKAEKAIGENFNISWKAPIDKQVFDLDRFRIDHPELAKKYTKPEKQTRRFAVTFPKGKAK
jgi:putative phage-type endonuclease